MYGMFYGSDHNHKCCKEENQNKDRKKSVGRVYQTIQI